MKKVHVYVELQVFIIFLFKHLKISLCIVWLCCWFSGYVLQYILAIVVYIFAKLMADPKANMNRLVFYDWLGFEWRCKRVRNCNLNWPLYNLLKVMHHSSYHLLISLIRCPLLHRRDSCFVNGNHVLNLWKYGMVHFIYFWHIVIHAVHYQFL